MANNTHTPAGAQPRGDELFLDHIAHWVPDAESAAQALRALGFTLTPFSEQHQNDASGALVPAGAGNRCVMLELGYLEFLTPLADTPIGAELKAGISRYTGVHIGAFACADTEAGYEQMQRAGVEMRPLAHLERQVEAADGTQATARFSVARPLPGQIPEGRVQMLTHHTPELLWQQRYVTHANGALALTGLLLGVEDVAEAARRYAALFQRHVRTSEYGAALPMDHGRVYLMTPASARTLLGDAPVPAPPCMVSYVLRCRHLDDCVTTMVAGGATPARRTERAAVLRLPDALGASVIVTESDDDILTLLQ